MQVKRPGFPTGPEQGVIVSKGDGATGWDVGQGLGCVSSLASVPSPLGRLAPSPLLLLAPSPAPWPEAGTGASGAGRSYECF